MAGSSRPLARARGYALALERKRAGVQVRDQIDGILKAQPTEKPPGQYL